MLLDNGQVLTYWFTYAPAEDDAPPAQQWLFDISQPGDGWVEHRPLWTASGGRFDQGLATHGQVKRSSTWMRQHRVDDDRLHFFYDYRGPGSCITGACWWDVQTGRHDLIRLTELAGTTCDNQSPMAQRFSGAWYNPDRDGEGFILEILPDEKAVIYWFTHTPDDSGKQAWMVGTGEVRLYPILPPALNVSIDFEQVHQPVGGRFGSDFEPTDMELMEWGELSLHFQAPNVGEIHWNSHFEEYGSGSYTIERLARPMLTECD